MQLPSNHRLRCPCRYDAFPKYILLVLASRMTAILRVEHPSGPSNSDMISNNISSPDIISLSTSFESMNNVNLSRA